MNVQPKPVIRVDLNVDIKYSAISSYGFIKLMREFEKFKQYEEYKVDCNFKTDTTCIFECEDYMDFIDFLMYIQENYKIFAILYSPYKAVLYYGEEDFEKACKNE